MALDEGETVIEKERGRERERAVRTKAKGGESFPSPPLLNLALAARLVSIAIASDEKRIEDR